MFKGVTLLAVIVLGCCLVSSVSAFSDCGSCSACGGTPAGGWGAPAQNRAWGMSFDDMLNAMAAAKNSNSVDNSDTTSESEYIIIGGSHAAGNFNWGVSNSGKFANLFESTGKFGDSQSIPSKYSSILKPDSSAKYSFFM